jgi:4-amino-4-deoxy-L-arabinose transferase-like glycosyltransferase
MITTPALVTREAAQRLPRLALWLMAGLYLLPGLVGRDPWRNADLTAYGVMLAIAEGRANWLAPTLGLVPVDASVPAHALGALFIAALTPLGVYAPLAARLPFVLLLGANMVLIWYAAYRLARTEAAQPVPFAFGGEALPADYARALADGALLAFMATLGLLQLGHETTPELMQLTSVSLLLWALAAPARQGWQTGVVAVLALGLMAASGAAELALACGVAAALVCLRSQDPAVRPMRTWVALATLSAGAVGMALETFRASLDGPDHIGDLWQLVRLLAWFTWPTAPLALLTLWRWRRQWLRRHVAVPALLAVLAVLQAIAVGGSDRALLLALPGIAVLAAFALPTLSRSGSAAVDWFSVSFCSVLGLVLWLIYLSFQTGWPPAPLRNAMAVAPDYQPVFEPWALLMGLMSTAAWLWLVRWRTARHQKALWKSLVLPAGGVLLNWLLAMTLLLHPLDYTRSLTPWVQALRPALAAVSAQGCVAAPGMQIAYVAALEAQGGWRVDARASEGFASDCAVLILTESRDGLVPTVDGWTFKTRVRRPTERYFAALVYERSTADARLTPTPRDGGRGRLENAD